MDKLILNNKEIQVSLNTLQNKPLMNALQRAYSPLKTTRVRIWYGDVVTGLAWPEENDVMGYISMSTGTKPCLILVYRRSSLGGTGILDNCIIRIDTTEGITLYKHPNFHTGLEISQDKKEVTQAGKVIARFPTPERTFSWIEFMEGNRYNNKK